MQTKTKLTRVILPALLSLVAVLLAACGGAGQQSASTSKASADKQILVTQIAGVPDIKTFDPGLSSDGSSIFAIDMVFTGLVQINDQRQVYDEMAASHSVASDGLTWTFKLRPDLKFSDGTPLTSTDVAYSIDRSLDPQLKSTVSPAYLALLKDYDKRLSGKIKTLVGDSLLTPDPQTLIVKANKKAAYFLEAFTYPCTFVIEKSLIDKYGNNFADHLSEGFGGAGPWKVSRYIHGKEIDFVPNPYYYGPKPQLKKVVILLYNSTDTAYKAYQANQIDTANIPPTQIDSARTLPDNQYHRVSQLSINYYTMNYLVKPFDNIKVRQAFALALNKDLIAHNIEKDTVIATNHIVPEGMPGYDANLTGPDGTKSTSGNPTLAKQLFQEGLKEEGMTPSTLPPITFTVSTRGSTDKRNIVAAVQQMWQNTLGVNVKVDDVDFNKLLDEMSAATNNPKGLQMWDIDWGADYPDPQDWLTLMFDKNAQNNNSNYGQNTSSDAAIQQKMQTLMEQADVNQNPVQRMQQYNQVEQQLVNDVAWLPYDQMTSSFAIKPCLAGVVSTNAVGTTPPMSWSHIYMTTAPNCTDVSQY